MSRQMDKWEARLRRQLIEFAKSHHGFPGDKYGVEVDSDAAMDFLSDIDKPSSYDIVEKCNRLAIRLARSEEYDVPDGANFWDCDNPSLSRFWMDAQIACEELLGYDVEAALESELKNEEVG